MTFSGAISPEAIAFLRSLPPVTELPSTPDSVDPSIWALMNEKLMAEAAPINEAVLRACAVEVRDIDLNGVSAIAIEPKGKLSTQKSIVHVHGGAYAFYSARSSISASAPIAHETGLTVISIDYTLAPKAKWRQIHAEVDRAIAAILDEGRSPGDVCLFGESAGGALAAAAALRMQRTMGPPSAVALLSPWSDITDTGETYTTLREAEAMYSYDAHLRACAHAYADESEFREPFVSPVYAAYDAGYPPTLIQGGTREIFLSNFVRHYQALDQAGVEVKLDLYEGMPHTFWVVAPHLPESQVARAKAARFMSMHLGVGDRR